MIHLLVGSYVQKPDSVFFSLIGRETIPLKRCILIGCHISTKLPVKKSGLNKTNMADTERGFTFSEDEFSTALAEALRYFKYGSLKDVRANCLCATLLRR